ncbi:MAG: EAL domain-containing protein [Rhodoferax sp.]|nr:MAG: EAL domain-containing protein [Rhodoferax sp.]
MHKDRFRDTPVKSFRDSEPPYSAEGDTTKEALKLVAVYATFASLWILFSDQIVAMLFTDPQAITTASMIKGWLFVAVTATLLFGLTKNILSNLQEALKATREKASALADSETRLQEAQSLARLGSYRFDFAARQWQASPITAQILGLEARQELSTDTWLGLVHAEDRERVQHFMQETLAGQLEEFSCEYRVVRPNDQRICWIQKRGLLEYGDDGQPTSLQGTVQDITEAKEAALAIENARNQLRATLDALPDLLFEVGFDSHIYDYHSHRHDLLAAPPEAFLGQKFSEILPPDVASICFQALTEAAQKGFSGGKRYSLDLPQGEHWFELSVAPMHKASTVVDDHYIMIARDVTNLHSQQKRLEHLEHFDPVTDLPNRLLLSDRLTQAMHHAVRRKQHVAVAYLDLDGFQAINERYGRGFGDQVLIAIAKRLRQIMRSEDSLARIGGDEFALVFVDLDNTDESLPTLERFLKAISEDIHIGDLNLRVTASAGLSFYPQRDGIDADQLLRQADQAMYQAKLQGKQRVHVFDNAKDHDIRGHNEFREHIKLALQRREFVLYYQPKVNMATGRVIGMEALIRWQHPEKGLLSPYAFLPEIEEDELAVAVGEWTLEAAFAQIRSWRSSGIDVKVSVNIGARQLQAPGFFEKFVQLAQQNPDVQASMIELEILETSAISDLSLVSGVIAQFASIGVDFALDDFGTGYSSLSYLKRLQVPTIKIDQSFVRDLLAEKHDQAILQAIIDLAQAFGRSVIAEGVETEAHGQRLLELGCPLAQGYAIARPMPAAQVPDWVRQYQARAA